ncbi:MAG: hypothetical protein ABI723_27225 [Bacteroidia bacterium]
MKKSILEITLFLIFSFQLSNVFGQAPQRLSYQAVIRNSSNSLVTNHPLGMQVSVLQGSGTGTPVYMEKQTPWSNNNGLVSIQIGSGTVTMGNFANIDWSNGPYFIKTETDPNGGTNYTITGVSQLVSVPYSLSATTAGKAETANTATTVTGPFQPAITSVGTLTGLTVTAPINGSVTGTASNVTGMVMPVHGGTGVNSAASNFVFAGPDGATGAPYFRAMVPNDLPAGSGHYIANSTNQQNLSNFNVSGSGVIGNSLTVNNPGTMIGITAGDNTSRTIPNLKLIGYSSDAIDGGGGLEIGDGGAVALRMMRTSNNNFKITTNFGSNFSVLPEGNFGINTETPNYKLDVNGTMHAAGNTVMDGTLAVADAATIGNSVTVNNPAGTIGITAGDNSAHITPNLKLIGFSNDGIDGGGGLEMGDGGAVALRMMRTSSNNFKLTTNFGSNFNIIPEGNLGINTESPAYKLDVNGTMRSVGNAVMGGTLEVAGTTAIQDVTSSASPSSGALTVAGGIGVAENINVGGALAVTGNASFGSIPTSLTAPKGDNSTQMATTEFVTRATNDATLVPGTGIDIAGGVISTAKTDYAFLGINNSNGQGAQGLYLNWPYSDYISGVTFSGTDAFTLHAGKMYEVTATMYIYNAANESYFYDFKNTTDNIEYTSYGAYFGEGTPYVSYTTQTIRFMYKPGYDTDFVFQRTSLNSVDPNIIGNIIIKEIR